MQSQGQKSNGFKSGDRGGHDTGHIHLLSSFPLKNRVISLRLYRGPLSHRIHIRAPVSNEAFYTQTGCNFRGKCVWQAAVCVPSIECSPSTWFPLQGESSSLCWLTKGKQLCWGIPSWTQLYCQIYKNISTTCFGPYGHLQVGHEIRWKNYI